MTTQLTLGTWLSIGSPVIAELAAVCGLDWVLLDLEHGCGSEADVPEQLRAVRGGPTRAIVRVPGDRPDLVARMLDQGADGVMVPHVDRVAQAEQFVRAASYPPRGQRGVSRTVRAHDYGLRPLDGRPAPLLIAQIETLDAVHEAAGIAQVDGIDVLFVGPADLQHDLAVRQPTAGAGFENCLDRVVAAARAAGKAAGILVREPGDLPRRMEQGFTFVAVQSDVAILRDSFRSLAALDRLPRH
jgi:2-dehydro-3-deoxyglucarate aldolase/4-hydroxy-2-oxoheptanedioate aldolase